MERLQRELFEAAAKGNVSSLHHLLIEDPLLLERVTPYYNSETALHVSALLGHLDFVKQIIGIKPELTHELNSQRSSPLHLASAKGHADVVRELLSVVVGHETMCLACDKDGLTPLHLAAVKGRAGVMELLLRAKPDAARLKTLYGGETILHLCVKNWQLEALKLLVSSVNDPEFVKCRDGEGNTLLHLAVEYKQLETINLLVNNGAAQVDVNAVNNKGLTAMDVLNRSRSDVRDSEISESLKRGAGAGAGAGASILGDKRVDDNNWFTKHLQETTNALMVVASVIAALASQIAVNPPGGVWQDNNYLFDSNGKNIDPLGNPISHAVDSQNRSVLYPHRAGYSILATNDAVLFIQLCNSNRAAFYSSVVVIFLVVSGFPLTYKFFQFILMLASLFALIMALTTYNLAVVAWVPLPEAYGDFFDKSYGFFIISPRIYSSTIFSLVALCFLWVLIPSLRRRCKAASSAVPENNNSVV